MHSITRLLRLVLEAVCLTLMGLLTLIVLYSVVARALGASPGWYDELASALLAWITWVGGAYAALRGAHMTTETLLVLMPLPLRKAVFVMAEAVVMVTMLLVVIAGVKIVETLAGETLLSLPWLQRSMLQGVLPVSAAFFILGRILVLPEAWRRVMSGTDADTEEVTAAIARAEEMHREAASESQRP